MAISKDNALKQVNKNMLTSGIGKKYQFAKVLVTRDKRKVVTSQKVVELFDQRVNADYSTDTIVAGETVYELNYKIHCTVDMVEGAIQIENDMLGIFGQGPTFDEAEKSFGEEFDCIYCRYNELPEKKLTKDVLAIKRILSLFVKNVSK
jgi:hypothetical protein